MGDEVPLSRGDDDGGGRDSVGLSGRASLYTTDMASSERARRQCHSVHWDLREPTSK